MSTALPVPDHTRCTPPLNATLLRDQFGSPDPRQEPGRDALLRERYGSPPDASGVLSPASGARSPPPPGVMSPPQLGVISPPPGVMSPGGLDRDMYAQAVGQHLEQLAFYRAPTSAG